MVMIVVSSSNEPDLLYSTLEKLPIGDIYGIDPRWREPMVASIW